MATLYIMMGYPGAGKTTTATIIHKLTGAVHLWADQIRCERFGNPTYDAQETDALYRHLNQVAEEMLATQQSVIYDTNFNFYRDRQLMRRVASKHNAKFEIIWIKTPREVALNRATKNAHQQGTRILGNMPVAVFEHLSGGLELPHKDEPVITLDGTKLSLAYVQERLGLN